MKTKCFAIASKVVCSLACFLLLADARQVQAESFSYDFEGLSTDVLVGQDGWTASSWGSPNVVAGTSVNTTKVAQLTGGLTVGASRAIPTMVFTSADTTAEQRLWAFNDSIYNDSGQSLGGAVFDGTSPYIGGIGTRCGVVFFRSYSGTWNQDLDHPLVQHHWYEVKLNMNFATVGGLATLSYRDVTADTGFVESTIVNVPMGLTPDGLGQYSVSAIDMRLDTKGSGDGTSAVDNYFLTTAVPEPSSLVLSAVGLLGLVAYAWRKRR